MRYQKRAPHGALSAELQLLEDSGAHSIPSGTYTVALAFADAVACRSRYARTCVCVYVYVSKCVYVFVCNSASSRARRIASSVQSISCTVPRKGSLEHAPRNAHSWLLCMRSCSEQLLLDEVHQS
jgi:hypothetical protein